MEKELRKIRNLIHKHKSFFLAGHINPDGDTLGSMLAFSSVLKRMGKKVYMFSNDPIPENLRFLPKVKTIKIAKIPKSAYDVMILLESSTPKRAGDLKNMDKKVKVLVNIDHHKTSQNFGDINIIDNASASTAEIIYRLFYNMKVKITKSEAICLYTGIVTDTGRFHYPATNPRTLEIAARLLQTGFDFSRINDLLFSSRAFRALKILGKALLSMELAFSDKAAFLRLTNADFKETNTTSEHTESIINHGMMVPGVKISVLFRQEANRVTITFRSKGNIDVSALAKKFGGGGHKHAAGCKSNLSLDSIEKKIRKEVSKILKK
ncbi:MAG: bifunctional oligoribonuclease/PAP phosphatase NrnA [Elusimicrobiales bacterium]|nr:bifunctional oligoribonuclease/PAP phosphatase NrnA [Elusimicrobiales bacterium]MCK5106565.1 bifunctional oligoribonuclease/PAP phosphatase NrnA [Elusimicrobiales bacterium]MCK5584281.1 bifunctional oligoribonuclease/PAP phosphatase NrnA [Elusimicrobiales bacterium]